MVLKHLLYPNILKKNIEIYKPTAIHESQLNTAQAIAFVVDGANDASVGFAARLLEQGVQVRVIDKISEFDDKQFSRGSVIVSLYDNQFFQGNVIQLIENTAKETLVSVQPIKSGLGDEDLPDIGGSHFKILKQPKIAILTHGGISSYDYGAVWHSIDSNLGIRHSHLDSNTIDYKDLRRYNTLVLPDRYYGSLSKNTLSSIDAWVKAGGTLIAIDGSIKELIDGKEPLSQVKQLEDSFKDIHQFDIALQREWLSQQSEIKNLEQVWQHNAPEEINYPWKNDKPVTDKELIKRDKWLSQFMPSGAIVASRTDQKHWLTFGTPPIMPVLICKSSNIDV